jgi:YfiH family protein
VTVAGRFHPDWLVPDWPAPAGVKAVFTSRAGGISTVPFDSMNLGSHVGDLPASVGANRHLLKLATGTDRAVFLNQVHGARVELLDPDTPDGHPADACMTAHRQLACTVMVADCLPVLLTSLDGARVAAAHAGWRGLAGSHEAGGQGVIESVFESFRALAHYSHAQAATKTIAWLGPCIGPASFEVGEEVRAAFEARQPRAVRCFIPIGPGKYLADLPALARLRLQALGVTQVYGNDGGKAWCTVSNPSRFFSHRRDAGIPGNGFGTTGRMAACIWLDG